MNAYPPPRVRRITIVVDFDAGQMDDVEIVLFAETIEGAHYVVDYGSIIKVIVGTVPACGAGK